MIIKVLFVEKEVTIADLLVPSLERKGYKVSVAHTRRQALSRCRSSSPDILVVDVASFGPAGYDLVDAVQSRLGDVPTILLLQEGHAIAGSRAEAFMTPPFTSRKLLYRLRKAAESFPSRTIEAGALVLDPATHMLHRGRASIRLRPKEAALLALFMRNPGRVLTRREIMKAVWDTDYVGDTRTLNVHVRWLRLKIEDDPGQPRLLRTVRGVGYRFELVGPPSQATGASADRRVEPGEPRCKPIAH
jgi:DNA-binding response OmpR family regulator